MVTLPLACIFIKVKHALIGGLGTLWQKIGPKTAEADLSVSYMDKRNRRAGPQGDICAPLMVVINTSLPMFKVDWFLCQWAAIRSTKNIAVFLIEQTGQDC